MPLQLYEPEKFQVIQGEGVGTGFCTVWNEPHAALQLAPDLHKKSALIGTLYSRPGVNIIVRNLALNPQIHTLYVWGHGHLSQTPFGVGGKHVLTTLWNQGLGSDRAVPDTNFSLDDGIDPAVVETMRRHVRLIDVSDQPLSRVVPDIADRKKKPYMPPVAFPAPPPPKLESFPSEGVGWLARGTSILAAWQRVVQRVMLYGTVKGTQYGALQKELIGFSWVIESEDPDHMLLPTDWPDDLRQTTGTTPAALEQYKEIFLSSECPPGISYTYGNRLMAYPGPAGPLDQIHDGIEQSLHASPDSRRAVATTIVPQLDMTSSEPPCLSLVQCLQSQGALHMLATFRSHDIFKAAIPNAYGLRHLQARLARELGFSLGKLQITSQSAHIYEPDWDHAQRLVACAFTKRKPTLVLEAAEGDPRGNVLIRLQQDGIHVTVTAPDGTELMSLSGKTAVYLKYKLDQLDLLTQPSHWMDIGMELQKAQIAQDRGLMYTQDRPLRF